VAVEYPLNFIRSLARNPPPVMVALAGPQVFVREYALDALRERMARDGFRQRSFHLGGADRVDTIVDELESSDLFAQNRLITIRVLRSFRERPADDGDESEGGAAKAGEAALAAALERLAPSIRVAIVVERDTVPAKIRRIVEQKGVVVNCPRPFDNQLSQFAEMFARTAGRKLSPAALDLLVMRCGADLAALANSINLAALSVNGERLDVDAFADSRSSRGPELFELADALARGEANEVLTHYVRALQIGRDPIELLALEIIPVLRRMMAAAALLDAGNNSASIAGALGLPPQSSMATHAITGARRFGSIKLAAAHQRACVLDERLKMGLVKSREQAVGGLLMELLMAG